MGRSLRCEGLLILRVVFSVVASTHFADAMQSTILEQRNEYGGKTVEEDVFRRG